MLRKQIFLSFSFFFCAQIIYSQTLFVFARNFEGEIYELKNEYFDFDSISAINFLDENREDYLENSYLAAGYDSIVFSDSVFKAFFTIGYRYYWENLIFDTIIEQFPIRNLQNKIIKNEPVDIYIVEQIFSDILEFCQNNGYPFAEVSLQHFRIHDSLFNAELKVDTGNKYYFDSISIKGEVKLEPYFLENYLAIKKGSEFSMQKVNRVSSSIRNISFIEEGRPFELAFSDSGTELILYLKNRKANSFMGMIGILPSDKTESRVLITGDVNLSLQNSFGRGELLSFNWERYEQESQNLRFESFYPYIFKSHFGAGLKFKMEKRDTTFLSTDMTINFRYFTFGDNGFDVFYQKFDSYILMAGTAAGEYANIRTDLGGLAYTYKTTDNIFNPRKGLLFNASASIGVRKTSGNSEYDIEESVLQTRNSLSTSYFIPVFRLMTIKLKNQTAMIYSEKLYENELHRIGGLNTIRGFDELSLPASGFSITNLEFRYLFEENSALFAFYDFAYFEKRFTMEESYFIGQGIGAGINLQTGAGMFSLVYALGKTQVSNFDFNNSKIHIGYRNSF